MSYYTPMGNNTPMGNSAPMGKFENNCKIVTILELAEFVTPIQNGLQAFIGERLRILNGFPSQIFRLLPPIREAGGTMNQSAAGGFQKFLTGKINFTS